jgi:transcriptional regulator with XRE-family HTH domain
MDGDVEKQWCVAFGLAVARHRRALGINQAQLAVKAGLSNSQISLVERGALSTSITRMLRITFALGTTPSVLWAEISEQVEALSQGETVPGAPVGRPKRAAKGG